jgi:hypothetical protein
MNYRQVGGNMKRLVYLSVTIVLLLGLLPAAAVAQAPDRQVLLEQLPTNLGNLILMANPCGGWTACTAADDFVLPQAHTVAAIQLWAIYPQVSLSGDWTVVFHEDTNGLPGAQIGVAQSGLTAVQASTDLVYQPDPAYEPAPIYLTTLALSTPVSLDAGIYWIEIFNAGQNTLFGWTQGSVDASGSGRDGLAYASEAPGFTWTQYTGVNLSLRLLGLAQTATDTMAPVTTIGLNPAMPDGQNGWYTSDVVVTVSAADETGGSGVAETHCVLDPAAAPASFDDIPAGCAYTGAGASVSADGQHALYAASKDNAGNKETVKSQAFQIDKTAPQINLVTPVNHALYPLGLTVLAGYTCSDSGSGVASCSGSVAAGAALDTAAAGDKTFAVQATDQAGNTASATADYRVMPATPGPVVAWGDNSYGQTAVPAGLSEVIAIAAGCYQSLALKGDGTVVSWGGRPGDANVPAGLSGVAAISAGCGHSLALKSDGTVILWSPAGQIAVPAGLVGVTAIAAGYGHDLAVTSDGTVHAWGGDMGGVIDVPASLGGVIAVAAGEFHSLALKSDGTVVAWGCVDVIQNYGQCAVPAGLSGVTAIAAGELHSLALKNDGTVVAWGMGYDGQTNVPTGLNGVTAIAAGLAHSLALTSGGTVAAWGFNVKGQATVPSGLTGVTAIAGGMVHSLAVGNIAPQDAAAPVTAIGLNPATPNGQNGWYTSDVVVTVSAVDETGGSGLAETRCVLDPAAAPATFDDMSAGCAYTGAGASVPADGQHALYAASKDNAGNKEAVKSQAVKIDKTAPTISISAPANTVYLLNQAVPAAYACADGSSGVGTCAGPVANGANIDTATAGSKTFTVNAADQAGNTASASASYKVGYNFGGFLAPVDSSPTVNTGKAGRTYPVKWQLRDASGNYASALSAVASIKYQGVTCGQYNGDPTDPLEAEAAGSTSLRYDTIANQYIYNWKTPGTAGCYTLSLTLDSGQVQQAYFNLK